MMPISLQCEYQKTPYNIDTAKPRFSWSFKEEEGSQKAYRIVVKSESEEIMWDTGKVNSSKMTHIEYDGTPLKSFQRYDWTVTIWDESKQESSSSYFYTGCLDNKLWRAKWISIDEEIPVCFKKYIKIEKTPKKAIAYVSALGVFELQINRKRISDDILAPGWTDYKRIQYMAYDIAPYLKQGENEIIAIVGEGWFAGNIAMVGPLNYGGYPLRFLCR